jgi:DNA-binding CsgD family transcriptional regulator
VTAVFAELVVFPRDERRGLDPPALSHREREVLRLAVQGHTNDEIGARLYLATSTVKSHLTSAFAKLAVRSRSEAAALIYNPEEPAGRAILAELLSDRQSEAVQQR